MATEHVLLRTVAPKVEPLGVPEAKLHIRVDLDDEDQKVDDLIRAAREEAEKAMARALLTQTWTLTLPAFPAGREPIELRRPPIQSVSSITYTDAAGDPQTVANFVLVKGEPGMLYPANGATWPTGGQEDNPAAVTVVFVAGYGSVASDVPYPLREAMLLWIETRYTHRGDIVTGTMMHQLRAIESTYLRYAWDMVVA